MQRFQSPQHRQRQERRKWQHIIYSKWVLAVLIVLIVFMSHATWKMYKTERESLSRRLESARQHEELSNRDARTKEAVRWAQTADGQEYQLRTKYAVGRPGESLYVIVDPQPAAVSEAGPEEKSWWEWVAGLFK